MEIKFEREGASLVVQVEGRIDGTTAPEFEDGLKRAISQDDRAVVINFGGVSYVSSAGLRAILLIAKYIGQREAKFALYALQELTREVFEISGFDQIIQIRASKAEALAATSGG